MKGTIAAAFVTPWVVDTRKEGVLGLIASVQACIGIVTHLRHAVINVCLHATVDVHYDKRQFVSVAVHSAHSRRCSVISHVRLTMLVQNALTPCWDTFGIQ